MDLQWSDGGPCLIAAVRALSTSLELPEELRERLLDAVIDELNAGRRLEQMTNSPPPGRLPLSVSRWSVCEKLWEAEDVLNRADDAMDDVTRANGPTRRSGSS